MPTNLTILLIMLIGVLAGGVRSSLRHRKQPGSPLDQTLDGLACGIPAAAMMVQIGMLLGERMAA